MFHEILGRRKGKNMKISVLVDQNALEFVSAEFGFSCFIEIDNQKLLFDTGFSDVFLENSFKLDINLSEIDFLAFSHGHHDHTWGVVNLVQYFMQRAELKKSFKKPVLVSCPQALEPKWLLNGLQNGMLLNRETLVSFFELKMSNDPVWLTKNMVFLGKIERKLSFEQSCYKESVPSARVMVNGRLQADELWDDSALVCRTKEGLVIVCGCSHSGICNIVEYAKKVCGESKIVDIIGGLHLVDMDEDRLDKICEYFREQDLKQLHVCHCTGLKAKERLSKIVPVIETGAGLTLSF